jgi:hypothetical protein
MSFYAEKMAAARAIIDQHNSTLPADDPTHLDWSKIEASLRQLGATTEAALTHLTWEDLREAGIPKIMARMIANEVFRRPQSPTPTPTDTRPSGRPITEMRAAAMSFTELLSAYDPSGETHPAVSKRLVELAGDKPFIIFAEDNTVLPNLSAKLLREIRQGDPPREFYHTEHGLNIPGHLLAEARQAWQDEADPGKKRIKGAMYAGAMFNRATDIFTGPAPPAGSARIRASGRWRTRSRRRRPAGPPGG